MALKNNARPSKTMPVQDYAQDGPVFARKRNAAVGAQRSRLFEAARPSGGFTARQPQDGMGGRSVRA
eukprot:5940268-Pleurochrysis_carterae.AAC.6